MFTIQVYGAQQVWLWVKQKHASSAATITKPLKAPKSQGSKSFERQGSLYAGRGLRASVASSAPMMNRGGSLMSFDLRFAGVPDENPGFQIQDLIPEEPL